MIEQVWNNKGYQVRSVWLPLESYEGLSPIVQVYGVCFTKDGKVLIIRNPLPNSEFTPWYLPGGTPEAGEKPETTLIRELGEEADVRVSNLKLLGAFEVFFPNNPNKDKSEHYYQLRYFALIEHIDDQTPDPSDGNFVERKFINAEDFTIFVEWGDLSKVLIEAAKKEFNSLPH